MKTECNKCGAPERTSNGMCRACDAARKRVKAQTLTCEGIEAPHQWTRTTPKTGRPPKLCPEHSPENSGVKRCLDCGEVKPVEAFTPYARNRDGLYQYCKPCSQVRTTPLSLAWSKRNPESVRVYAARVSAKRAAVARGADAQESMSWRDCAKRDGMKCAYCGTLTVEKHESRKLWPTLDHVIPLSRGGRHTMANAVLACFSCNCSKGSKTLKEWKG